MIWEAWQYLTTPITLPYAKKMGFLREAIAMAARSQRCQRQWQPHYQACQQAVLEACERVESKRKLLILGAGTLQDIPLAQLSQRFDEILLVDLVFLRSARSQIASYRNVHLVEWDVTESLLSLYRCESKLASPKRWLDDSEIDLVVSLNLTTQLPLLPFDWLTRHCSISDEQAERMAQALISQHLHYLRQFAQCGSKVCLIADRYAQRFDTRGQEIERFDLWWGQKVPKTERQWFWPLMPLGEVSAGYSQTHCVGVTYW
ncbi:hypothetical protein QCB44_05685 [Thiomicrorhabdus sp. zzn3]|uniref:hypothetical protein n=1 Tax=Thiomicrorhabdus sp. zzn3 TaxID=3039775 RepID=UPI002436C50C|nr:hypothetical protein [Thiomicrorhabdus sp. zzn3]MDG6778193.1 hypothetical protein [Thiomicrorhabdus sp. zzn3]